MRFNELNLSWELLRAIEDCGYTEATYIQKACIPVVLSGGDIIGQSQTGTGKTAAFAIPLVELLQPTIQKRPQALILSPTRELALQVTEEIRKFAKYKEGLRTVCIYGGQPIQRQIQDLKKGADIVVGTPGRILDHIKRRTLRFNECRILVLDEADEMLNMGFREDLETLISHLPSQRQTILFSATMPQPILEITDQFQNNPIHIKNPVSQMTAATIEQIYYECSQSDKLIVLMQLLQMRNPGLAMIFCNTKKMVDELVSELVVRGYPAAGLHGDMKQEQRTLVMEKFKKRRITMLVATDVAARGIDVETMDIVINYDFPQEEYYVHRIGRCGRAGKQGLAITLITPRQREKMRAIEQLTQSRITKQALPSRSDMQQFHFQHVKNKLVDDLSHSIPKEIQKLLEELLQEGYRAEEIAGVLLYREIGKELFNEIQRPKDPDSKKARSRAISVLLLDIGKKQDIAPAHIISALAESSGIRGKDFGKIEISQKETTVEVPQEYAADILECLKTTTIHGIPVHGLILETHKNKTRKRSEKSPRNKRSQVASDLKERKKRSISSKHKRR